MADYRHRGFSDCGRPIGPRSEPGALFAWVLPELGVVLPFAGSPLPRISVSVEGLLPSKAAQADSNCCRKGAIRGGMTLPPSHPRGLEPYVSRHHRPSSKKKGIGKRRPRRRTGCRETPDRIGFACMSVWEPDPHSAPRDRARRTECSRPNCYFPRTHRLGHPATTPPFSNGTTNPP